MSSEDRYGTGSRRSKKIREGEHGEEDQSKYFRRHEGGTSGRGRLRTRRAGASPRHTHSIAARANGLEDVLQALEGHDEWMQIAFFLGKNPRLGGETPVDMLKAGELKRVVNAAQVYGEHGAA